jgi:hypothetical protein
MVEKYTWDGDKSQKDKNTWEKHVKSSRKEKKKEKKEEARHNPPNQREKKEGCATRLGECDIIL